MVDKVLNFVYDSGGFVELLKFLEHPSPLAFEGTEGGSNKMIKEARRSLLLLKITMVKLLVRVLICFPFRIYLENCAIKTNLHVAGALSFAYGL